MQNCAKSHENGKRFMLRVSQGGLLQDDSVTRPTSRLPPCWHNCLAESSLSPLFPSEPFSPMSLIQTLANKAQRTQSIDSDTQIKGSPSIKCGIAHRGHTNLPYIVWWTISYYSCYKLLSSVFNNLTNVFFLQFTRTLALAAERLQYYMGVWPKDYNIT